MPELATAWITVADGAQLTVRVVPRARRTELTGVVEIGNDRYALGIRLAAPPVDGAANAELCTFLADLLDLRRSAVTLRSGETSRIKTLHIAGDGTKIAAALGRALRA